MYLLAKVMNKGTGNLTISHFLPIILSSFI